MNTIDYTILIPAALLMMMLTLGSVIYISSSLSKRKKATEGKLKRIQQRFGDTRIDGPERSIRVNVKRDDMLGRLSELLPRKEALEARLGRAGLKIDLPFFAAICAALVFVLMTAFLLLGVAPTTAVFFGISAGLGLPHMWLSAKIKGRTAKFTKQFPEAMDLMVRGLKAGLPVNETMATVAHEIPAPTGEEFQRIIDQMRMGKTLEEALWAAADRLDTNDFKFFVTSLTVQRETGGNLGETLGNLSTILRQRQAMKLKVKAMASEAKASAYIVGALPIIMLGMIMMMNYDYGITLFTHPTAIIIGIGAIIWKIIGIIVMAKMISFEV